MKKLEKGFSELFHLLNLPYEPGTDVMRTVIDKEFLTNFYTERDLNDNSGYYLAHINEGILIVPYFFNGEDIYVLHKEKARLMNESDRLFFEAKLQEYLTYQKRDDSNFYQKKIELLRFVLSIPTRK